MSIDKVLDDVTPEIYERMRNAVETGSWPNGVALTDEQKANCLQLLIAYDERYKNMEERVGYLPTKPKSSRENSTRSGQSDHEPRPMRIIED